MTPVAAAAADWLQNLCRGIVTDPTSVTVVPDERNSIIELHIVAPRIVRGRIIGSGGKTIGLIRELAFVFAQTQHLTKITVIVDEPERMSSHAHEAQETAR